MITSYLFLVFVMFHIVCCMPKTQQHKINKPDMLELRKRSDFHPSERTLDCFDMVGIEGDYVYTPTERRRQCTVYFIGNFMDELVEFQIRQIDIPCNGNKLQIFDGWKLGGAVFPSEEEHAYSMENRQFEACGEDSDSVFISSQNVAMLSFPTNIGSFKITFRTRKNPKPCHAMAPDSSGEYDLLNYGERRNCTFLVIYPVTISIIQMTVGDPSIETKLKCFSEPDQVQFLEGNGLDYGLMRTEQVMCGSTETVEVQDYESTNDTTTAAGIVCKRSGLSIPLQCQSSTVRLISSGQTDNHVRIKFSKLSPSFNECL
ncbi:corticotropin-releasing factor-binding protein-like [Antedon mediterranea]|uniref:corticotropin-releasing factor-binding protein-like n=1 Tax=Antedon mediterranea TaxID=105859 RepID=UPI003AF9E9AA